MAAFVTCDDLDNLPCNCDGSETKVTAGANTTVTGAGTAANPYVISSSGSGTVADGSETKVIAGTNTTVTGTGTAANPYVINSTGDDVAVSNTTTGHRIGTITINGTAVDINETVTTLGTPTWDSTTGLLSIPYTDENGVTQVKTVTINPTFVNTDEQQLTGDTTGTVKLTLTPVVVGGITNYTVKADLPLATSVPSGSTNKLVYDAARGGWYVDVPTTAGIGSFAQLRNADNASLPGPFTSGSKVNFNTLDSSFGTMVVPNAATGQITLKAGGIYKIDAGLFLIFDRAIAAASYSIYANGVQIGTTGTASPLPHSTANIQTNEQASAFLAPTVDTVIELRFDTVTPNVTSVGNYNLGGTGGRECYLEAYCIGLQ